MAYYHQLIIGYAYRTCDNDGNWQLVDNSSKVHADYTDCYKYLMPTNQLKEKIKEGDVSPAWGALTNGYVYTYNVYTTDAIIAEQYALVAACILEYAHATNNEKLN